MHDRRIGVLLERQREAFLRDGAPSLEERREHLKALEDLVRTHHPRMAEVLNEDFGQRSAHETMMAEALGSMLLIKHTRKHLAGWMKPRRQPLNRLQHPFAKAYVQYQPLGVIGVMAPWNYPYKLCLVPLAQALAAGNRVMLKPSELTPGASALIRELLAQVFDEDRVAVVTGGPDVAAAFSRQKFDHLMFTGSTATGRQVMKAAAENLVPVTLELGGKSPAIIGAGCELSEAAGSIAFGKLINAGQTCIAPDYGFLPEGRMDNFATAFASHVNAMYPTLGSNGDYSSMVSDGHYARVRGLITDAQAKGADIIEINTAREALGNRRKIAPTLVLNATDDMAIMQEEVFGPVLPLRSYRSIDEVITYINARPRPLALYHFTNDNEEKQKVLSRTLSGGVTINDTMMHVAIEDLPFGGVGASGMGAYHGEAGFRTFSHARSVMEQGRIHFTRNARPPFGARIERIGRFLIGG
ncbi:coniferyl aldehyde dehydrogenase [Iodidimonas sp. SYSU 1G8]|uniref:coniferyl aldehyde dehydrogenase n=1 Tax=Iodidimonas sp. SYSU 1G8 TaxID=3133967 RepID=UPI0031FE6D99